MNSSTSGRALLSAWRRSVQIASARQMSGGGAHAGGGAEFWKKMTFFAAFPCIILANINAFMPAADGGGGHVRPEFVKYEYLRVRTKPFPWGDGNHTLIHNPHVNALPDGYEDDH